ncbi:Calcium channel [Venturia nashicola]|nr:Calcium channel [Venturia nashicola]
MGESRSSSPGRMSSSYIKYTTVTGFFAQDENSTVASTFNYATENLGLLNRTYPTDSEFDPKAAKTQWQRFEHYVQHLAEESADNEQYKLIYMGRHGEGYHNVAESFYGTPAWDCHWSELDGNDTITWADAHITPKGEAQALVAHEFWKKGLVEAKIPAPEKYYSSPLDRCAATANLTFKGLDLPEKRGFKPVIKELMREALGIHTCDRRSSKSAIHSRWPYFEFENGFAEEDPLWVADVRESNSQLDARVKTLLDDIFTNDDHTFISFTSHSGAIGGLLRVLGHIPFSLQTGGVIPVLVKAETVRGTAPSTTIAPGTSAPTCSVDST